MDHREELDALDARRALFKRYRETDPDFIQQLLGDYSRLVHQVMKRVPEAGSAKQVPTDKVSNPYVLVIIDCNGYAFGKELVDAGSSGGAQAAGILHKAVEEYVDISLPALRGHRIVVRVYADFWKLATFQAQKAESDFPKLVDFAGGFTKAVSSFDFVHVMDMEGVQFKVSETLKLGIEDEACGHLFFAGCHDGSHLSTLQSYAAMRQKITAIRVSEFEAEYLRMGFQVTSFPDILKWAHSEDDVGPRTIDLSALNQVDSEGSSDDHFWSKFDAMCEDAQTSSAARKERVKKVLKPCKFFAEGFCRYGSKCKYLHQVADSSLKRDDSHKDLEVRPRPLIRYDLIDLSDPPAGTTKDSTDLIDLSDPQPEGAHVPTAWGPGWKTVAPDQQEVELQEKQEVRKSVFDAHSNKPKTTIHSSKAISSLPTSVDPGFVLVNAANQRLDPYLPAPTISEWDAYRTRVKQSKPCNKFHLQGSCDDLACAYDHSALERGTRDTGIKKALAFTVRKIPCKNGGACRDDKCIFGHVCLKKGCKGSGSKDCRLSRQMHGVDLKVARMESVGEHLIDWY